MNKPKAALGSVASGRSAGFTLIELTVVIVIISLLVTAVVIHVSGTMQRFHQQRILQEFVLFDQRARQLCVSSGRYALMEISPEAQRLSLHFADGRQVDVTQLQIGAHEQMVILNGAGERSVNVEIAFSPTGLSELYAVGLRNRTYSTSRWLLFLGSGQVKAFETQRELEEWIDLAR